MTKILSPFLLIVLIGCVQIANAEQSAIPFKSVSETFASIKSIPGAALTLTEPDRWAVINISPSEGGMEQWTFTPEGHYAHPAVAKRKIKVAPGGGVFIESAYLCEAQKEPCDKFVNEFKALNDEIQKNLRQQSSEARQ